MDIQTFTAQELHEWVHAEKYAQLPVVPMSPHRALSYLHNPRGLPNDPVCLVAWEGNNLIGFRTLLADHLIRNGKLVRFGWLSGVWVEPSRRRSGIASRLLEKAYKAWDQRLMSSNHTPISHSVIMGSGNFHFYHEQAGRRLYTRFDLQHLLAPRHQVFQRLSGLLGVADRMGNALRDRRREKNPAQYPLDELPILDMDHLPVAWKELIATGARQNFSQRGLEELQWFLSYPWIKGNPEESLSPSPYPFSSYTHQYTCYPIGLLDDGGKPETFFLLSIIGSHLIIPFFYSRSMEKGTWEEKAYSLIRSQLLRHNIAHITVFQAGMEGLLKRLEKQALYSKPFKQVYLATKDLLPLLPDPRTLLFQDGEGDFGFTA